MIGRFKSYSHSMYVTSIQAWSIRKSDLIQMKSGKGKMTALRNSFSSQAVALLWMATLERRQVLELLQHLRKLFDVRVGVRAKCFAMKKKMILFCMWSKLFTFIARRNNSILDSSHVTTPGQRRRSS